MADFAELAELIERYRGTRVDFGTAEDAPSDIWIRKAEECLGCALPPSYLWFLRNYGGGEVYGDEVYSIYCIPFDTADGGDIVFQYLLDQSSGSLGDGQIAVLETDFGETFFLDANERSHDGEYPVKLRRGADCETYASTFAGFLERYISTPTAWTKKR